MKKKTIKISTIDHNEDIIATIEVLPNRGEVDIQYSVRDISDEPSCQPPFVGNDFSPPDGLDPLGIASFMALFNFLLAKREISPCQREFLKINRGYMESAILDTEQLNSEGKGSWEWPGHITEVKQYHVDQYYIYTVQYFCWAENGAQARDNVMDGNCRRTKEEPCMYAHAEGEGPEGDGTGEATEVL